MNCSHLRAFILPVIAMAVGSGPCWAGPKVDLSCESVPNSQENCTPLVGCLGISGVYFTGRAIGWSAGTFAGDTNDGFSCVGHWTARNSLGLGQAVFSCDNGGNGVVYFTYRDVATGTASGGGFLDDGQSIKMWSGHNIHRFMLNDSGAVDGKLVCGGVTVPIS